MKIRGQRAGEWGIIDSTVFWGIAFVFAILFLGIATHLHEIKIHIQTQNTYLKILAEQSVELNKNLTQPGLERK